VEPLSETNVHRTIDGFDLERILSVHVTITVTNDYTFQHGNYRYQIEAEDIEAKMRRNKLIIQERLDGSLKAYFKGKYVHFFYTEITRGR
jgi:hypothetical protein